MYGSIRKVFELGNIVLGTGIMICSNNGVALLNGVLAYRDYYQGRGRDPALTRIIGGIYTGVGRTIQSAVEYHRETSRQVRRELSCILESQKY